MKLYTVKKSKIVDFIGIILFKIVLDYSYIGFVVPNYQYLGFVYDFNIAKYIEGWVVYIVLFLLVFKHKKHLLFMTLLITFILLIVPTITLYAFKNEPSSYFYSIIIPYTFMLFLITSKRVRLYYFSYSKQIIIAISILIVFIVLFHYAFTVGFGRINFDLNKVYELRRSDYGLLSNEGIFGYLNSWATKVFNIFLIAVAILRKKYMLVFLLVLVQIMLFGFSGHKMVLFSLFLLIGLYYFDKAKNQSSIIIYTFLFVISALLFYFYLSQDLLLPSILIRRVFFVPANLNYVYLEYFSSQDYIYWSNSILKYFVKYPYDVQPVFVIGDYLGYPKMAANTGIFGSGYMHFGVLGIFLYVLILAILMNIIHQFKRLPIWFVNAVVLMPLLSAFISSDLFTTFLTHGLLISIAVLYLYCSPKYNTNEGIK